MSTQPQSNSDEWEIPPGILRSMQAYWRDLPQLLPLRSRKREWVAYHGDERVGFARTRAELYQECFRRGIHQGEFYVGRIRKRLEPPWEPIEIEPRYGEIDDDDVESIPEKTP
jgi:hypothetical protein